MVQSASSIVVLLVFFFLFSSFTIFNCLLPYSITKNFRFVFRV